MVSADGKRLAQIAFKDQRCGDAHLGRVAAIGDRGSQRRDRLITGQEGGDVTKAAAKLAAGCIQLFDQGTYYQIGRIRIDDLMGDFDLGNLDGRAFHRSEMPRPTGGASGMC